jgi:hypothetical protein
MILSFSEDRFKERILSNDKKHTIRTDRSERWKKGHKIHFWRGNPRNTKATPKPHEFHLLHCTGVQKIEMIFGEGEEFKVDVSVDNRLLTPSEVAVLAINDGFDTTAEMLLWFQDNIEGNSFKGRLIHWTKLRY